MGEWGFVLGVVTGSQASVKVTFSGLEKKDLVSRGTGKRWHSTHSFLNRFRGTLSYM